MWLALGKDTAIDDRKAGQMLYVNTSGFIFVIFADFQHTFLWWNSAGKDTSL